MRSTVVLLAIGNLRTLKNAASGFHNLYDGRRNHDTRLYTRNVSRSSHDACRNIRDTHSVCSRSLLERLCENERRINQERYNSELLNLPRS